MNSKEEQIKSINISNISLGIFIVIFLATIYTNIIEKSDVENNTNIHFEELKRTRTVLALISFIVFSYITYRSWIAYNKNKSSKQYLVSLVASAIFTIASLVRLYQITIEVSDQPLGPTV